MRKAGIALAFTAIALFSPVVTSGTAEAANCRMYEKSKGVWYYKNCSTYNHYVRVREPGAGLVEGCVLPGKEVFVRRMAKRPDHAVTWDVPCRQ